MAGADRAPPPAPPHGELEKGVHGVDDQAKGDDRQQCGADDGHLAQAIEAVVDRL
jgi:hypothetical protein